MFLSPDEDDDDEFKITKSSNLSNIFEDLDGNVNQQNTSLKYSAPKQPKKNVGTETKETAKASSQLAVIHSSTVNVFKFEDEKYHNYGKLGLALLGNYEAHNFILLLYKDKKSTISKTSVSLNFNFTVQENNYATFYDDQRINWCVNFDNVQLCRNFAFQVGLAKINCIDSNLESPITQELSVGSGPPVSIGDISYVKYCCWVLTDHKLGQVLFSNFEDSDKPKLVKVGESGLIQGFDAGILNMKKGSLRLLILQSHLFADTKQFEFKYPANATLVLKVHILEDEVAKQQTVTSEKPSLPSKLVINNSEDLSVRARGASLTEQLQSNPKVDKAKLISRMAKMGQPMVPMQGSNISNKSLSSESETEEERSAMVADSHPIPNQRLKLKSNAKNEYELQEGNVPSSSSFDSLENSKIGNVISKHPMSLYSPQQMSSSHSVLPFAPNSAPLVLMPGQSFIHNSSPSDSHLPILLSEVRTQNTEIRMQMSQVSDKVDRVLAKVDKTVVYPTLEVGVLSDNINRIFQENENLKSVMKDKDVKIQSLTEKINDLLQINQRVLEKSNTMLEQRSDLLQNSHSNSLTRITLLEQDKTKLEKDLSAAQTTIDDLQNNLQSCQKLNSELRSSLLELSTDKSEKQSVVENYDELKKEVGLLKSNLATTSDKLKDREMQCQNFSEKITTLKEENVTLAKEIENIKISKATLAKEACQISKPDSGSTPQLLIEEIKKVMNAVYRNVQKEFMVNHDYPGKVIKATLANTIRQITLEVIEHYSGDKSAPLDTSEATSVNSIQIEKEESEGLSTRPLNVVCNEDLSDLKKTIVETIKKDISISPQKSFDSNISEDHSSSKEIADDNESWRPQPPPFFEDPDSEGDDDWLK